MKKDNIAAIATPPGKGGVAIVRISGNNLINIARIITKKEPRPRIATYCNFYDENDTIIDNGLIIYFKSPNSFTGEDILELHGHGGIIVSNLLLNRVLLLNVRLAEPGEFSKRAFLNGKIDLTQAESIADLIDASSKNAARAALNSLSGNFAKQINTLNEDIKNIRILVEANIDFSDEDIEYIDTENIHHEINKLINKLNNIKEIAKQGVILRNGINIALIGEPNAGKSSLLNALAQDEIAIVTNIPGTTRDAIKKEILINGIPVHIIDTAGIHETNNLIEQIGINRSLKAFELADIILIIIDNNQISLNKELKNLIDKIPNNKKYIKIYNKIDLKNEPALINLENNTPIIKLSAKTGIGLNLLKDEIIKLIDMENLDNNIFIARKRHINIIDKCLDELTMSMSVNIFDLIAENLRIAHEELSKITGKFTSDDLLGEIFSTFCIGK